MRQGGGRSGRGAAQERLERHAARLGPRDPVVRMTLLHPHVACQEEPGKIVARPAELSLARLRPMYCGNCSITGQTRMKKLLSSASGP